jgi:hypothetical protein
MCDKCKTVFSELEDGWQTFTVNTMKLDEEGRRVPLQQALDACPSCALIPQHQFQKELDAAREGDELQQRIAKLERETGIDKKTTTTP